MALPKLIPNGKNELLLKFHFSGICGAGMGNVALLLREAGHQVKGSDANTYPPMSTQLEEAGILLFDGYGPERLNERFVPDVQVISNVLSKDHPEVLAGVEAGIESLSFPQVLEQFILPGRVPYVVAGTHGKTTTASLLSQLLKEEGAGYFLGGILKDGSSGIHLGSEGAPFVMEGDEYDTAYFDKHSKFLHYRPKVLILTHLEWDHVDIFPTFEDMLSEFRALIALLPEDGLLVYCGDHEVLRELAENFSGKKVSYGLVRMNDVYLEKVQKKDGLNSLSLGGPLGGIKLETPLIGKIYHLNAMAAFLAANLGGGYPSEALVERLSLQRGAKRRLEVLKPEPNLVISDFAHHPTAVKETLEICRESHPELKLVAVFDPRNATSRRSVFEERMSEALGLADRVILAPVHQDHRLNPEERLDGDRLASRIGGKARAHVESEEFVQDVLNSISAENLVLIMSCGACHGLFDEL
jgi:UDP-N-acetylmuramate: L-alanyl-gamma-D-glutamyl-meso-diaminopimelate ligase